MIVTFSASVSSWLGCTWETGFPLELAHGLLFAAAFQEVILTEYRTWATIPIRNPRIAMTLLIVGGGLFGSQAAAYARRQRWFSAAIPA